MWHVSLWFLGAVVLGGLTIKTTIVRMERLKNVGTEFDEI